jgi:hypothetical protein
MKKDYKRQAWPLDIQACIADAYGHEPDQKQKTDPHMEIHHHAHSPRTKFFHYVYEFFMFFLAVTASFCVENVREHYVEQQRAKQFASLLVADLKKDVLFYERSTKMLSRMQSNYDSLETAFLKLLPLSEEGNVSRLVHLSYLYDLRVNTATYAQMKSSGSLRYFEDPRLLSKLQEYYEIEVPRAAKWSEKSAGFFNEYLNSSFVGHTSEVPGKTIDQHQVNIIDNYQTFLGVVAQKLYTPAHNEARELIRLIENEYDTD